MQHQLARQWTFSLNTAYVDLTMSYGDHIRDIIVHHVFPTKLVVEIRGVNKIAFGDIDIQSWGSMRDTVRAQIDAIYRKK